jgi:hypothetical protein
MSTLTGKWSLQKFGDTLISSIRFGLFIINKSTHIADVWVIRAIRKRNRIYYRAKSTNNPDHWSQYRHLRNDVIRLVREAKTE